MDAQPDDADIDLSTQMASVVLGDQADVVVQAIGEAVAESGIRSALGQVESGIRSALDQQESGIRSASLLGVAPIVPYSFAATRTPTEVEAVRAFPDVNADRPSERVREREVQQGEVSESFHEEKDRISVAQVAFDENLRRERGAEAAGISDAFIVSETPFSPSHRKELFAKLTSTIAQKKMRRATCSSSSSG